MDIYSNFFFPPNSFLAAKKYSDLSLKCLFEATLSKCFSYFSKNYKLIYDISVSAYVTIYINSLCPWICERTLVAVASLLSFGTLHRYFTSVVNKKKPSGHHHCHQ